MKELTREESSQLCRPTTAYRGSSFWGRSPNVICDWCKKASDDVVLKKKAMHDQLVCLNCIAQGRK